MSYDSSEAGAQAGKQAGFGAHGFRGRFGQDGDMLGWAKSPGFNPLKLITVLGGLAIFPPLGIAALAYFLWNGRRGWSGRHGAGRHCGHGRMGRTGNTAFDAHSAKVMDELEAERQAFAEHRAEQRRKRDAEAFEAFQANRAKDAKDKK